MRYLACPTEGCPNNGAPYYTDDDDAPVACPIDGTMMIGIPPPDLTPPPPPLPESDAAELPPPPTIAAGAAL